MADERPMPLTTARGRLQQPMPLAPAAYSESLMPALRLARSSRMARRISTTLITCLAGATLLMAFAPWQQSISGSGTVVAYSPDQRPQILQSRVSGRVYRLGENIFENARVREGQVIVEMRDLDESYYSRLSQQLVNSQRELEATRQQSEATKRAREAAITVVESLEAQLTAYMSVRRETEAAQDAYVEMAKKKIDAEQQQLIEYQAALPQLEAEFERHQVLQREGNVSLQRLQEIERKTNEQRAKVKRGEAYVLSAESELEGKVREREAKIQKAQVDIDYAKAALQKAQGDISKAESDVAKAEQAVNKAEKELRDMEVKISRQENQLVTAPFDGILVEITPNLGTAVLNAGDPIATIVPETADRSVQLMLSGNDAPLVEAGRHVRLQFEGWPAIQFTGWPSVAVGTFGGEVVSVDATDDGAGKFRILVRPDPTDPAWPDQRFLRQGVRANGWVLLERVPLWFEVWRRLNGFPPVVDVNAKQEKPPKAPKLPKP